MWKEHWSLRLYCLFSCYMWAQSIGKWCTCLQYIFDIYTIVWMQSLCRCERNASPPGIYVHPPNCPPLSISVRLSVAFRNDSLYLTPQSYAWGTYIPGDFYFYHTSVNRMQVPLKYKSALHTHSKQRDAQCCVYNRDDFLYLITRQIYPRGTYIPGDFYSYHTGI